MTLSTVDWAGHLSDDNGMKAELPLEQMSVAEKLEAMEMLWADLSRQASDAAVRTHPAASGGPPKPPKKTARDLEDQPSDEPHIDIPDPVVVKDLALA